MPEYPVLSALRCNGAHFYSMSGPDDCASQEIENCSNSTRNSRRWSVNLSKLNNRTASGGNRDVGNFVTSETLPRLPLLEKINYVENWILSSGENLSKNSPEKLSPVLSSGREKRLPESPLSDYRWKRARGDAKEKSIGLCFNERIAECRKNEISPNSERVRRDKKNRGLGRSVELSRKCSGKEKLVARLVTTDNIQEIPTRDLGENVRDENVILSLRDKENPSERQTPQRWNGYQSPVSESSVRIRSIFTSYPKKEESPLRWNGYQGAIRESLEIQSSLTSNRKDETDIDNRDERFSENSWHGGDKSPPIFEPESPLRWNGYGSQIRESIKPPDTPSLSSPIIAMERSIQSSFTSDPKEDLIFEDQSPISTKSPQKIQPESPLRWNGYRSKIGDFSKLSDPSYSPIVEREWMIQSSSTSEPGERLILNDRGSISSRNLSFGNNEQSPINYQPPESSKLPATTVSLSFPIIQNELAAIRSISDSKDYTNTDALLGAKQWPRNLRTVFNSINDPRSDENLNSSKLPDTRLLSPPPSPLPLIDTELYEVESLASSNVPDENTKIDSENESGSDVSISSVGDVIENVLTPVRSKSRKNLIHSDDNVVKNLTENSVERGFKPVESRDSDETYCSDGDPVIHSPPEVNFSEIKSQNISQLTTTNSRELSRNKSDLISQTSSPLKNNAERPIYAPVTNATRHASGKRKKAKRGSLVAKLQALASLRVSSLQIWQYQMSRPEFNNSRTQFVKLTIVERETRYGRHFLLAMVIEDTHNLLSRLFGCDKNFEEKKTVTLVIVPEINGRVKIRDDSVVDVYPPWEIMNQEMRVLSIIYFKVVAGREEINGASGKSVVGLTRNERVLEKFECPCTRHGAIDEACPVKFTSTKPGLVRTMFGS